MIFKAAKIVLIFLMFAEVALGLQPPPEAVPPEHQQCKYDKDCTRISLKCSCDCGVPINKSFLEQYLKIKEAQCKEYSGPYCKIACSEEIKCSEGKCIVSNVH